MWKRCSSKLFQEFQKFLGQPQNWTLNTFTNYRGLPSHEVLLRVFSDYCQFLNHCRLLHRVSNWLPFDRSKNRAEKAAVSKQHRETPATPIYTTLLASLDSLGTHFLCRPVFFDGVHIANRFLVTSKDLCRLSRGQAGTRWLFLRRRWRLKIGAHALHL